MVDARAMGIIFPNLHDENVPEIVSRRTMGSLPFAGRYRMIDFSLSGLVNAGVENIGVIARKNYQSLMDHLGNGREWDLARKRGGLILFPPYARDGGEVYRGRIQALASVMDYLASRKEEFVIMGDCDAAFNLDYKDLLNKHIASGADVTIVYERSELQEGMQKDNLSLQVDDSGQITDIRVNEYKKGVQNLSLNRFVMGREYLMNVVRECMVRSQYRFVQDFLMSNLKLIKVCGYEFTGYRARIYDMQSYFKEHLRLLEHENLEGLFPQNSPIYTKVRDEAPVRYSIGSKVHNSLIADGCIIDGEVENCVLFRGVHVGKGSVLKNCILMQNTRVSTDVVMKNVVTDKNVVVESGQKLRGATSFPVFIAKGCVVK